MALDIFNQLGSLTQQEQKQPFMPMTRQATASMPQVGQQPDMFSDPFLQLIMGMLQGPQQATPGTQPMGPQGAGRPQPKKRPQPQQPQQPGRHALLNSLIQQDMGML